MVHTLKELTLQQCSELGEGLNTYGEPKILKCGFTHVEARILGTQGYYRVTISVINGRVVTDCTCDMGGSCKHVRETGKAMYHRLRTMNINQLTPQRQYKESLLQKSRDELVDLLMEKWREENDEDEEEEEEEEEDSVEDYEYYHDEDEEQQNNKRQRY
ncbi:hypothetical protein PPL_05367 [Heterostelium album PN500]|uniref:SWIM-type domain-containing protein n=1 Tax=Heterostelium pallidum (strain ATCC 26659 / Pp 5 / PN500) TaxID=670386 RepID=D3B9Z6_HETP5|nr:hypothetical protein PPL_05367 [Heterostelium album PN500]EFA81383.1 hypothetical protein PPL_05367 [Heterostelium album PN500]|eukprot:XP_020433501.1 hypothetical protein PPL_05367 [Heterostelium album PN500]